MNFKSLCVFCGARFGASDKYRLTAEALGAKLAEKDVTLVYGGGHVGLMGAVADGCLRAGGKVIGVIPEAMMEAELAHAGLTELHVTKSMHERKALMASRAEAFLALPGGFGTMDELCEIVTWAQLQYHRKPIYLFNQDGFFDEFIAFARKASVEGFIPPENIELLKIVTSIDQVL